MKKLECPKCHSTDIKEGIPVICNKCGNEGAIDLSILYLDCPICHEPICAFDLASSESMDAKKLNLFFKKNRIKIYHGFGKCQDKQFEEDRRKRRMKRAKYYEDMEKKRLK